VIWGAIFWKLRTRGGPVLFVERQVAHAWAGSVVAVVLVFFCEILLGLAPLTLSPILPVITGMLFIVKAGTLSGEFYLHALASFLIVVPMALYPEVNQLIFGAVLGLSFFLPGLKYHRQRLKSSQPEKAVS
jgi:serine/threonine-protein kinase